MSITTVKSAHFIAKPETWTHTDGKPRKARSYARALIFAITSGVQWTDHSRGYMYPHTIFVKLHSSWTWKATKPELVSGVSTELRLNRKDAGLLAAALIAACNDYDQEKDKP